jgi:hypothetical protein
MPEASSCSHQTSFVADITVEEVKAAVQEVISLKKEKENSINFYQIQEV